MRATSGVCANSLNACLIFGAMRRMFDKRPKSLSQRCDMSTAKHSLMLQSGSKIGRKVPA